MCSRWRHPPKTVSPRPYCRSRRGRNGLGSETNMYIAHNKYTHTHTSDMRGWDTSLSYCCMNVTCYVLLVFTQLLSKANTVHMRVISNGENDRRRG